MQRRVLTGLGLLTIAVLMTWRPAAAADRGALSIVINRPVSATYPAIPVPAPATSSPQEFLRPTCAGALSSSCDVIAVTLQLPHRAADQDILVRFTLTWDSHRDNSGMDMFIWDAFHEQNAVSGSALPNAWAGATHSGTTSMHLVDPGADRYDLIVENTGGTSSGYRLAADLQLVTGPAFPTNVSSPAAAQSPPNVPVVAPAAGTTSSTAPPAQPTTATLNLSSDPAFARLAALGAASANHAHQTSIAVWVAIGVALLALAVAGLWYLWSHRRMPWIETVTRPLRDLRLFWKLLIPFLLVIVVVGISGAVLTTRYLTSDAQRTLSQSLLQRQGSAQSYLQDQEFALIDAARFAANVEGLPEAVAAGDPAKATQALASVAAVNPSLALIAATGPDGTSLAELTNHGGTFAAHGGDALGQAPAVSAVLRGVVDSAGDKHAGIVRDATGRAILVVAGPVRTDHVVGAVVVGIDAASMITQTASRSSAAAALYDPSGALLASSAPGAPTPSAAADQGGSVRQYHTVSSHRVLTGYTPVSARGERLGTLGTTVPVGSTFAAVRSNAYRLALLVALGIGALVAVGVVLSRSILASVNPLLETNRALGRGELTVRAPVKSNDELGELAQGFNLMAGQLQASYEELERRVADRTEELQRLYEENVDSSEARRQLFASIGHEFRTPLFAILAGIELLTDPDLRPSTPGEVTEYLGTIETAAKMLLDRVNEILDLAASESHGMVIEPFPVTITDAWDGVASTVVALARAADLQLQVDLGGDLPMIFADPTRLRQILLNLTSNAIKYTPAGGRVSITARRDDDMLEVAVADTGRGIPKEVGDDVFEPYYRVKETRAGGEGRSTGLGLAITRRLVDAHGGKIWYTSRPGRGSTFRFTLPLSPVAAET